jgi:hypothetical protein
MRWNISGWIIIAIFCLPVGCSKSPSGNDSSAESSAKDSAPAALEAPAVALAQFLEAVRTGNDEAAGAMLTQIAQKKAAALNLNITPPASDTAKFTIGEVKYVKQDGAQVASTWTDMDAEGKQQTDEAVWVLRKEAEGWRVAGVGTIIFPNEPPVQLSFENPEEIEQVRKEIQRRSEKENIQAQETENQGGAIRR